MRFVSACILLLAATVLSLGASVGGRTSPDGVELCCDLPGTLHQKNIASRGLGCCVFRSLDHASRWQNVPCLDHMPEWMVSKGIEGGGYPEKVDKLIPKIAADRGQPVPDYIQVQGADFKLLQLATQTGRMVCTTYSKSPTGRYGGQRIAHMVNVPHCDSKYVVVLDNNYIGEDKYEWMSHEEARKAGILEWVVILLNPSPPMPPKNRK